MHTRNFRIKIIATVILIFFFANLSFGQNKDLILPENYYKVNKTQKKIVEFYLLTRFYYPFGKIRSFNKMYVLTPDLIALDKNGKILDFDSYKTEYKMAKASKQEFSVNLFYLTTNHSKENNEAVMSYTVLEPDWENVVEVKEYEYKSKCPIGCEELYELPIRKVHKPVRFEKFNQKFLIFYKNDYD